MTAQKVSKCYIFGLNMEYGDLFMVRYNTIQNSIGLFNVMANINIYKKV